MANTARNRRKNSVWDRGLKKVGEFLVEDDKRKRLVSRLRLACRVFLVTPCVLYGILLIIGMICFPFAGENNVTIAFFLYLPRVIFLLPAAVFLPLALISDWRSAIFLFASCLAFFIFAMGWESGAVPKPTQSETGKTLSVLTYNRGQHANQSLQPFKNATDPDIIILQESGKRASRYAVAEGYEKFTHTLDEAEFTLLSRYPILGSQSIVPEAAQNNLPPAARFELDFAGTRIALYAIHTESPRDTLLYYRRGAFLWGILGFPGTPFASKRKANQAYWDGRIAEARELKDIFARDPLPTLIAGDLNAPAGGYIHRLFLSEFQDAHREGGAGFGFTFPGTTRNPLSGGGPWMRIDYLFCDAQWEPVWCITEKDRPSQHRAVTAQFRILSAD